VNKEQSERCRDLGAQALKNGDFPKAVKMLQKSLQLYPLPGVEALLAQADKELRLAAARSSSNSSSGPSATSSSTRASPMQRSESTASNSTGADGRAYTEEQKRIVQEVLRAREGGRGAHYRVLRISDTCTEADVKKAYRKLSLKVHPDKNSAPHAAEAFKSVGLAYATLSDHQKRAIYDRYGEEDPDNRGGGMAARGGGMHMRPGQHEVSPEEIFNMFFGGGMPGMRGAGPGFHVHTTGFGPGVHFQAGNRRQPRGQPQQQAQQVPNTNALLQLLPILLIILVSFFKTEEYSSATSAMPGEGKYFSLTVC
jgi:DnaJ-domain-containing protein 1